MIHRTPLASAPPSHSRVIFFGAVLLSTFIPIASYAQTPTPTPITKPDPPTVQTPSTVGRIPKWTGVSKSGIGIIGDSIITENNGNLGIDVINPSAKLTVGGTLTAAATINTDAQYNISGARIVGYNATFQHLFLGAGAGQNNVGSPGIFSNTFIGSNAGYNATGGWNTFVGASAGFNTATSQGADNSFFGVAAGYNNRTGQGNSFFGRNAGAGGSLSSGSYNAAFGFSSGLSNVGFQSSFFGAQAGKNNSAGTNNLFLGYNAGLSNTTESNNTFIGANSNGAASITNATALGANAVVTQSNSVVLGSNANIGIGTSAPRAKLHVIGTTAGQFEGNVSIQGNISVSGSADLNATNAIHANTATSADSANSLANTATVNGSQISGALTNATISGSAITGNVTASQITGNLTNATLDGNRINFPISVDTTMGGAIIGATNQGYMGLGLKGVGGSYGVYGESLARDDGVLYSAGVAGQSGFYGVKGVSTYDGSDQTTVSLYTAAGILGIGTTGVFGSTTGVSSHSQYAPPNVGVWGNVDQGGTDTIGVLGRNTRGGTGVLGSGKIAVHGITDNTFSDGVAGLFDGNVTVNGNLTVTGTTNLALTVNHDSTLSGSGTAASPLSVVSVPNGVVTTGSYANPSWITSLDGNKLTTGTVVKSVNGIADNVNLVAGNNVTITPSGNSLTISTSPGAALNPKQLALKRWYSANQSGAAVVVGGSPQGTAFDGSNIWVASAGTNTVSKIRASDGEVLGTYAVGPNPRSVEFDGVNIWVANFDSNTVTKLRASTGELLATVQLGGSRVWGLAFDGTNIWASCWASNTVYKIGTDGNVTGSVAVNSPLGLAYDGSNIWAVNNSGGGQVTKISGTGNPQVMGVFNTNDGFPFNIAFDGTYIWVGNSGGSLSKFRISDGQNLGLFGLNTRAGGGIAFDGSNLWVAGEDHLVKFRVSDNTIVGSFPVVNLGAGVTFDGANIWVGNAGNGTVTKH